jgi:hypothetical protein
VIKSDTSSRRAIGTWSHSAGPSALTKSHPSSVISPAVLLDSLISVEYILVDILSGAMQYAWSLHDYEVESTRRPFSARLHNLSNVTQHRLKV